MVSVDDSSAVENLKIADWKQFLSNNDEIELSIEKCSEYVSNMYSNCSNTKTIAGQVEDALSGLKTVTVTKKSLLSSDYLTTMNSWCDKLVEYMTDKGLKVVSSLSYAELVIDAYNNGTSVDKDVKNSYLSILKGIGQNISDSNVLWVLKEFVSEKFPATSFLFGLTASTYISDAVFEGGDFVVGDAAAALFEKYVPAVGAASSTAKVWINTATGAAAVAVFETIKGALDLTVNDEGELTGKDWQRVTLNAGAAVLTYAEWTAIAGLIGGPAGVAVAAVASIFTSLASSAIIDEITGDKIIYEYELNGKTYKVPRNGSGKDGTYDVVFEREKKAVGTQYKKELYYDWYEFSKLDNGGDSVFPESEKEWFNDALDKVRSAKSANEAEQIFEGLCDEDYDINQVYTDLCVFYGFDIKEWWKVNCG